MKQNPIILGIDTSCDETSAGVVFGDRILSNVISSQVKLHKVWGGVVPDIARRAHKKRIDLVIKKALASASNVYNSKLSLENIDAIAVTYGPGLAIALEVGLNKAKQLSKKYKKPLIAVNHLEGHLLSSLIKNSLGDKGRTLTSKDYPYLGIIISGKHTELVFVRKPGKYEIIGETLDDAVGEAYDKVGRMLNLGYPAGPVLTEMAKKGDPKKYPLPIPMHKRENSLDFSFSGLKTAVYYLVKKELLEELTKQDVYDISASFEYSAIKHLQEKIELAINRYRPKLVLVGGGVGASVKVRRELRKTIHSFGLEIAFPYSKKLFMDNGAMIAYVGVNKYLRRDFIKKLDELDREPRAKLGT